MKIKIHNLVILRTPAFPIENIFYLDNKDTINIFLNEALIISSPDYLHRYSKKTQQVKEYDIVLYKYMLRAIFRPTPFGLFAGYNLVKFYNNTEIIINDIKRHTRLDMHYLHALISNLTRSIDFIRGLKFYPNNSIYQFGNKLRYVEYSFHKDKRNYRISEVDNSEELTTVFKLAKKGAYIHKLSKILAIDDISTEEAEEFIFSLIENQILVSELEHTVTGIEGLPQIVVSLSKNKANKKISGFLQKVVDIDESIEKLDKNKYNAISEYQIIIKKLEKLGAQIEKNKLFQTDLIKTTEKSYLKKDIKEQLLKGINILKKVAPVQVNPKLEHFINRYIERYEDEEMPLLQVLDTETGIGYPNPSEGNVTPLMQVITIDNSNESDIKWRSREKVLFKLVQKNLLSDEYTIKLDNKDLANFNDQDIPLPPSFSIMFRIVDFNKDVIFFEAAGGSSAVSLLGRFAHADKNIEKLCLIIASEEEKHNPNVIFAEIVHLPENRIGNILLHPRFRKYEIPYLAKSSITPEYQIPLQDILISIRGNRIILRSKRLNKEIIPRLSNAHNYSLSELPVYQFLCDVQNQDCMGNITFDWGPLENEFLFLPRVEYQNLIFSLAKWQLPKKEWQHLLIKEKKDLEKEISSFKVKWKMPRFMILCDGDNELFFDFENKITIEVFLNSIKSKEFIVLKEYLFDENTPIKDKNGGRYINQFVASVINEETVYTSQIDGQKNVLNVKRRFTPGTEWIYFKYYCGTKTADKFLLEEIKPLTEKLLQENLIDQWFFIRYNDNNHHLRIRYHLKSLKNFDKVIFHNNKIAENYLKHGLIWNIKLDTYKRELERYDAGCIHLTEQLFFLDSTKVLDFLNATSGESREEIRWLFGLKTIDDLLECFRYSIDEKLILLEKMKKAFAEEFNIKKPQKLTIDKTYRNYRKTIDDVIDSNNESPLTSELVAILNNFRNQLVPYSEEIIEKHLANIISVKISDLLSSYIHMHVNRLIPHSQRFHELIMYDFLYRHYKSKKARIKNESN